MNGLNVERLHFTIFLENRYESFENLRIERVLVKQVIYDAVAGNKAKNIFFFNFE